MLKAFLSKQKGPVFTILRKTYHAVKKIFVDPERFLKHVSGVIHVGANLGQERELYAQHNLKVIWIEPIPHIFEGLKSNIRDFPAQAAFNHLVTDRDGALYDFHIASNAGASSSIYEFADHKDIWPHVHFEETITLTSSTLCTIMEREKVDVSEYDALIMDTQGSELLVLKGAESLLSNFKYIKTEVADFESYAGCCRLDDLNEFLSARGFTLKKKYRFATRKQGGAYYDVLYVNDTLSP